MSRTDSGLACLESRIQFYCPHRIAQVIYYHIRGGIEKVTVEQALAFLEMCAHKVLSRTP